MTFSESELIPSYNRLWGRYGKLLHRYLGCLGDHRSTGAGGDAIKKGMCVCVRACVREKERDEKCSFCQKCHSYNTAFKERVLFAAESPQNWTIHFSAEGQWEQREEKAALVFAFTQWNGIDPILIKLS